MTTKNKSTEQTTKYTQEEILERAKGYAQQWIDAIRFDGKYDMAAISDCLSTRTGPPPEGSEPGTVGNRCIIRVVDSPTKVQAALRDALDEAARNELIEVPKGSTMQREVAKITETFSEANRCVWDYYLMAFYESAMQAAGLSHYFTDQTLLPAFKAGLGYIVNYGDILVGVVLPEAHFDDRDNLHFETGPALRWGDSVAEYWWHGTEVKKEWIEDKNSVDPRLALTWENIEQRRALCEIIGWDRVLSTLKPRTINEDPNPQIGTLLEVDLPESGVERFIKVECGTGRSFVLPVPAFVDKEGRATEANRRGAVALDTALKANAWTYNLTPDVLLALKVRT